MSVVERVFAAMGTAVTVRVVGEEPIVADGLARAAGWFAHVESVCSRFDPRSELSRLVESGGAADVSPLLFEALRFARAVAEASDGAFDPTVGGAMLARGRDRRWRDGGPAPRPAAIAPDASWRDLHLDDGPRAVRLARPMLLDLGAVAKGLAVDLAARELAPFGDFAIDAGGDVYLGGRSDRGAPWTVGIRHPRRPDALVARVTLRDAAVCTSGDYERPLADGASHLLDPRAGRAAAEVASATVIAPRAMVADALSTAAAVLGVEAGIAFLEAQGVDGLLVTRDLAIHATRGWSHHAAAA